MIRLAGEKFTPDNIAYCQSYINFMTTADPFRVKFFDEAGFKLPDCANPKYRHSMKGQPCTEITRITQTPNVTPNFLSVLNGVMYANTLNGASNTVEFFNFFHEGTGTQSSNMEISLWLIMLPCTVLMEDKHQLNGWTVLE